jgi:hypothetical protein
MNFIQEQHKVDLSKKKRRFAQIEDQIILNKVAGNGPHCWKELGQMLNRNPKQIRDRYNHYLKNSLNTES